MLDSMEIARLEEHRQAVGTADICSVSEPFAGGVMSFLEPGSWSNQACAAGLAGEVSEADFARFVTFYESRGVEPRIEVCPYVDDSLVLLLGTHGFVVREFENVWCRSVPTSADPGATMSVAWPVDGAGRRLEIRRADAASSEDVRLGCEVGLATFFPEPREVTSAEREQQRQMFGHPRCDGYIASFGDDVAGVCAMESAPPMACLFGMATVPAFRRLGVQQAMMSHRLLRAAERGCEWVAIHSKPGIATERNARRMGFQLAYTKVCMARAGEGLVASP